jgi:hypothetical protein
MYSDFRRQTASMSHRRPWPSEDEPRGGKAGRNGCRLPVRASGDIALIAEEGDIAKRDRGVCSQGKEDFSSE